MKKIDFKNGTLIKKAKVEINGTIYDVEPAQYEGTTPLSAENMNAIQNNVEEELEQIKQDTGETILYENANGNSGNITLTESAKNFKAIEIYYRWNNYHLGCVKIQNPINGTTIELNRIGSTATYYKHYTINEETLTSDGLHPELKVDRVIGYQ